MEREGLVFVEMREVEILLSGIHTAGLKLKRLDCSYSDPTDLFADRNAESNRTVFRNLHHLKLEMRSPIKPYEPGELQFNEVTRVDYLADLLSTSQSLCSLDLSLRDSKFELDLNRFVQGHYWPSLSAISLHNMGLTEEQLVSLLEQYATTLKTLTLGLIWLREGSWKSLLLRIRNTLCLSDIRCYHSWSQCNKEMAWSVGTYDRIDKHGKLVKCLSYALAIAIRHYILHGGEFDIEQWPYVPAKPYLLDEDNVSGEEDVSDQEDVSDEEDV